MTSNDANIKLWVNIIRNDKDGVDSIAIRSGGFLEFV